MHLIVARRDLTGFQHLHPKMSADGTLVDADDAPRGRQLPRLRRLQARRRGLDARPPTSTVDGSAESAPLPAAGDDGDDRRRLRASTSTGAGVTRRRADASSRFDVQPRRQAGRGRALPRRRRPPGRAARGRPRLPARPSAGGPGTGGAGPLRDRVPERRAATASSSSSSTGAGAHGRVHRRRARLARAPSGSQGWRQPPWPVSRWLAALRAPAARLVGLDRRRVVEQRLHDAPGLLDRVLVGNSCAVAAQRVAQQALVGLGLVAGLSLEQQVEVDPAAAPPRPPSSPSSRARRPASGLIRMISSFGSGIDRGRRSRAAAGA